VTDATALTTKQLDKVLETIGMDCNPGYDGKGSHHD
jgi:hypothetical protein